MFGGGPPAAPPPLLPSGFTEKMREAGRLQLATNEGSGACTPAPWNGFFLASPGLRRLRIRKREVSDFLTERESWEEAKTLAVRVCVAVRVGRGGGGSGESKYVCVRFVTAYRVLPFPCTFCDLKCQT